MAVHRNDDSRLQNTVKAVAKLEIICGKKKIPTTVVLI